MTTATNQFLIEYELNDLFEYANKLSNALGAPIINDKIIKYPKEIADGGSKFFRVNEYISFQLADYAVHQKMVFKRLPSVQNDIIIVISAANFTFTPNLHNRLGCNEIIVENNAVKSAQCKSAVVPETIVLMPGNEIKLLYIFLKESWLDAVLPDEEAKRKLVSCLNSARGVNGKRDFLNPHQSKLVEELFNYPHINPLAKLYYESRVLSIVEGLLSGVLAKEENAKNQFLNTNLEDVKVMQKAADFINSNIDKPFPGVESFSKMCFMSRTKFINLFQKIYGMSSYDYYQKKRLNLAFERLKTGRHSVADIAGFIGYSSVNNFALAFKREFGVLPRQFLGDLKKSST